jgi:hypothetical protein
MHQNSIKIVCMCLGCKQIQSCLVFRSGNIQLILNFSATPNVEHVGKTP